MNTIWCHWNSCDFGHHLQVSELIYLLTYAKFECSTKYMPKTVNQQQQPFYGTSIQNNPGESVPKPIRHINPHYHHYPPQYL